VIDHDYVMDIQRIKTSTRAMLDSARVDQSQDGDQ
jgi:hypothetical protein